MLRGLESKPHGCPIEAKLTVSTQLAQKDASRSVWYPRAMLEKRFDWNPQHRSHGMAQHTEAAMDTAMLLCALGPLRALASSGEVPGKQCLQAFKWFDMLYWRWQFLFPF